MLIAIALFAGFLDATGGGGGFIMIPALVLSGMGTLMAFGTGRLIFLIDSASACYNYKKAGVVIGKLGVIMGIPAILGAWAGSSVAILLDQGLLRKIFALYMLVMIAFMFFDKRFKEEKPGSIQDFVVDRRIILLGLGLGFVCGVLIGIVGAGLGIVITLVIVYVFKQPLIIGIGTSQIIITLSNIAATATYGAGGYVDFQLGIILGLAAAVGVIAGAYVATHIKPNKLRYLFIGLMVFMAIQLLVSGG